MIISERIFDCALETIDKGGALDFELDSTFGTLPLNTTAWAKIIPQLFQAFPDANMTMQGSVDMSPTITFAEDTGITLAYPLKLATSVLLSSSSQAVTKHKVFDLHYAMKFGIAPYVNSTNATAGPLLHANITDLNANVTFSNSTLGPLDASKLQSSASSIALIVRLLLVELLGKSAKGIPLRVGPVVLKGAKVKVAHGFAGLEASFGWISLADYHLW